MKCLVLAVLALVAIVQAKPYLPGDNIYGRGRYSGGGGYGGGRDYGHSGFNSGGNGYLDEGYGAYGMDNHHDIRHQENAYDESVHQHQALDENIGGVSSGGRRGHLNSGYGGYESGMNDYGREFGHGYNHGI
ncbi:unnamed protein product [Arctia plantaginis]|uniref:Uncharacterized protein n=1 Tax=Arctia plantaginis TaxID=874455 RepID=A0A8S1BHF4_ARCPL|nr:unnamed protein product [Arctia plantaginis]CAB3258734.1 unnamed protein product [Arctia plantaginis]